MKQIILIPIMFLLVITITLGFYSGESKIVQSFNNCYDKLVVNVDGDLNIDNNEYWFTNCSEVSKNMWECPCNGNFDLILNTKINTLNSYNVSIDYMFKKEVEESEKQIIEQIEVKNPDIIVEDIKYSDNVLELKLTSEGNKTVEIDLGSLNCPTQVKVNEVNVDFTCLNNILKFNASFSTKTIKLVYPTPSIVSSGGSSGGGNYITCQQKNMRYWLRNNICTYTCSDDDNSRMEMAKWVKVDYDCFANKTIIKEEPKIEIPKEEPVVEEEKPVEPILPKEENNLLKWIGFVLIVIIVCISGYWLLKRRKDNGSHKKSEELPKV